MTTDQLSALKSRLELAINETTGEFCDDLRAAIRVVAAMEKLEAESDVLFWTGHTEQARGIIRTRMEIGKRVFGPTIVQAIEADRSHS
jgi:hypothetical protein